MNNPVKLLIQFLATTIWLIQIGICQAQQDKFQNAKIAVGKGDYHAAIKIYDAIISEYRDKDQAIVARAYFEQSDVYNLLSDKKSQEEALRKAIQADPKNLVYRRKLAILYEKSERLAEAIDQYEEILKLDTTDTNVLNKLRELYEQLVISHRVETKKYLNYLQQAIQVNPRDTEANLMLAKFYEEQQMFEKAKKQYYVVLQYEHDNADAREGLARIQMLIRTYREGKKVYTTAEALKPFPFSVDRIIDSLRLAQIAFNAPETMRVRETWQVVLLMSMSIPSARLLSGFYILLDTSKIGRIYEDTVKVGTKMEAHLSGHGFIVKPITPIAQLVSEDDHTRWEWTIIAEEQGIAMLYLTLNTFIEYGSKEITQTIQTYRKPVFVYVKPIDGLLALIDKHISWIAGIIGGIIGAIVSHRLTLSHQMKDKKMSSAKKKSTGKKS